MLGWVAEWLCSGLQSRGAGSIPTPAFIWCVKARVAELVDARDLNPSGQPRAGSSPAPGTNQLSFLRSDQWFMPLNVFARYCALFLFLNDELHAGLERRRRIALSAGLAAIDWQCR